MTFIIYYQYNYNYYQYKQTEIKLEFYLFREYLPETILNHHLDRFCIFTNFIWVTYPHCAIGVMPRTT